MEYKNIELYSDFLLNNVAQAPDKMAVIATDASYTYAELNAVVNRAAHALIKKGVKCGDRVMVALPKDSSPFVTMFAIMKLGAVLVPVSPDYPEGRINKIKEDSESVLMITEEGVGDTIAYRTLLEEIDETELPRPDIDSLAPCMILYTSGSTGNPKGVMLRHHGYVVTGIPYEDNLLSYNTKMYGHVFLGVTTTTFAFFYMEYSFCLANACTYVMADIERSRNPIFMAEDIAKYNVDVLSGTPSRIMQYLDVPVYAEAFKKVNVLIIGGERVPEGMPESVHKISNNCVILNGYSQTEGNAPMIVAVVDSVSSPGFACHDWQLIVVDDDLKEVEVGETGELLMAGDNKMAGYVNLPEEMAAKTVEIDGVSWFRTGDYVKRLENNGYFIVGRIDQQIKLRGLRMEPGEIEANIQHFEGSQIEKAVVKVNVIRNTEHLVAYYIGKGKADEKLLRAHLKNFLPNYMIPDYFMYLEAFPLNQNGKIDFKNLPEIVPEDFEIVAPADNLELGILEECKRIVEYEEFGVTTPLEEVGFTSLLYIELASAILANVNVELELTYLMAGNVTVRSISDKIRNAKTISTDDSTKKNRYELTPQLYQFIYKNPTAEMYRKFTFTDKWTDAKHIRKAFLNVINSYPYMYTRFEKDGDTWYQIPFNGDLLKEEDIEIINGDPDETAINTFCKPYDLATSERLFDVKLYSGEMVTVLLHVQHVLMDHVFMEKFLKDIRRAIRNPNAAIAEDADYFKYTDEIINSKNESEAVAGLYHNDFHYVKNTDSVMAHIKLGLIENVLKENKLQVADFVFGLITQAYMQVMGEDSCTFFNMFSGRNNARYFQTAGFFPIRLPIFVKKDDAFYKSIGKTVISAMEKANPWDDPSYHILKKKESPYPQLSFNFMEYIEENDDYEMVSVFPGGETEEASQAMMPQLDFLCLNVKGKTTAVNLTFDTDFISKEKAEEILDVAVKLATRLSES